MSHNCGKRSDENIAIYNSILQKNCNETKTAKTFDGALFAQGHEPVKDARGEDSAAAIQHEADDHPGEFDQRIVSDFGRLGHGRHRADGPDEGGHRRGDPPRGGILDRSEDGHSHGDRGEGDHHCDGFDAVVDSRIRLQRFNDCPLFRLALLQAYLSTGRSRPDVLKCVFIRRHFIASTRRRRRLIARSGWRGLARWCCAENAWHSVVLRC